jgi:hypothetical protein
MLKLEEPQIVTALQRLFQPLAKALQGRTLVLYAGTPKTGTTSLQHWLMLNRQLLCNQGALYPRNIFKPDKPKHQWLLESLRPGRSRLISLNSELISSELKENSSVNIHSVILSTEGLYNHFHDIVSSHRDNWKELVEDCKLCIVITFRNPFDFSLSRYRQNLINPHSANPFHATTETLESLCQNPKWMLSLDYASYVSFWEDIVGPESVTCLPYSNLSLASFCRACNIFLPEDEALTIHRNVSFGTLAASLIRAVNAIELTPEQRSYAVYKAIEIESAIGQHALPAFSHSNESKRSVWHYCKHKYIELIAKRPELTLDLRLATADLSPEQVNGQSQSISKESGLAFICCIQPGFLEEQTILLAQSIRLFCGRYRDCPIYAISPCGETLSQACVQILKSLNVSIDIRPLNIIMRFFRYANKAYALEHAEAVYGHETNVFLDSDTLFVDEPFAFTLDDKTDFLARPVDVRGICRSPNDDNYDQYWQECCDLAGVTLDNLSIISTTVDRFPIYTNWNGGLLVTRGSKGIGRRWRETLEKLWQNQVCARPNDFWGSGQVSFALATASLSLNGAILPEGYNVPIHLNPSATRLDEVDKVIHLHYHWMLEKESHAEGIRRVKSLKINKEAELYVSALKPLSQKRGANCTGFENVTQ